MVHAMGTLDGARGHALKAAALVAANIPVWWILSKLSWATNYPLSDALIFIMFAIPLGLTAATLAEATALLIEAEWPRAGAAFGAYLILGTVYALLHPENSLERSPIGVLLWPSLIMWQDACHLGLWACPTF